MSHIHGAPDNSAEWLDMLLGRGPGDPDVQAYYPGEEEASHPKAETKTNAIMPERTSLTSTTVKNQKCIGVKKKL